MKKIFLSILMITGVSAAMILGSRAYFSDTEVSEENVMVAGSIDIAVDGENPWSTTYLTREMSDLKPDGHEITMEFEVENVGANPANVWKRLANVVFDGGVLTEPECSDQGGTYSQDPVACTFPEGHSDNNNFGPYLSYTMTVDGTPLIEEGWDIKFGDMEGVWVSLGTLQPGEKMTVIQTYQLDADAGNEFQGDEVVFDVELYAEQMMGPGPTTDAKALVLENKDTEHWLPVIGDGKWALLSWDDGGNYRLRAWGLDPLVTYRVAYWNGSSETGVSFYQSTTGTLDFTGTYAGLNTNTNAKYWLRPSDWNNGKTLWESNLVNVVP